VNRHTDWLVNAVLNGIGSRLVHDDRSAVSLGYAVCDLHSVASAVLDSDDVAPVCSRWLNDEPIDHESLAVFSDFDEVLLLHDVSQQVAPYNTFGISMVLRLGLDSEAVIGVNITTA